MKKKEATPAFNPGPINSFIIKLNRPSFILLITIYLVILVFIIFIVSPKDKGLTIVPKYEHQIFPAEIHPQITLLGNYTYDKETKKTSLRYNISATIQGRFNDSGLDPHLYINRFLLGSYLTNNKMIYFTEQTGHKTQISHSYVLDNTIKSQVPQNFYTTLKYEDQDGVAKQTTYREDVMLEILRRGEFNHNNMLTHVEGEATITDLRVNFGVTKETDTYTFSTRITLKDYARPYHVDMQSWVVCSDGQAYPFIGVYAYQDEDSAFAYSNRTFPLELNPTHIYCELHYYEKDKPKQTILYRVLIDDLPNNTGQEPIYTDTITKPSSFPWDKVNLIAWPLLAGITLAAIVYYYQKRKKQNS